MRNSNGKKISPPAFVAAALRVFLPHLAGWNRKRRDAAARYAELGLGEAVELPADEAGHVYHMFVVRTTERDRIAAALREADAQARRDPDAPEPRTAG